MCEPRWVCDVNQQRPLGWTVVLIVAVKLLLWAGGGVLFSTITGSATDYIRFYAYLYYLLSLDYLFLQQLWYYFPKLCLSSTFPVGGNRSGREKRAPLQESLEPRSRRWKAFALTTARPKRPPPPPPSTCSGAAKDIFWRIQWQHLVDLLCFAVTLAWFYFILVQHLKGVEPAPTRGGAKDIFWNFAFVKLR